MQDGVGALDACGAQQPRRAFARLGSGCKVRLRVGGVAPERAREVEQNLRPMGGPVAELAAHRHASIEKPRVKPPGLAGTQRDSRRERQRRAARGRPGHDGCVETVGRDAAGLRPERNAVVAPDFAEVRVALEHRRVRARRQGDDFPVAGAERAHHRRCQQHVSDPASGADHQRFHPRRIFDEKPLDVCAHVAGEKIPAAPTHEARASRRRPRAPARDVTHDGLARTKQRERRHAGHSRDVDCTRIGRDQRSRAGDRLLPSRHVRQADLEACGAHGLRQLRFVRERERRRRAARSERAQNADPGLGVEAETGEFRRELHDDASVRHGGRVEHERRQSCGIAARVRLAVEFLPQAEDGLDFVLAGAARGGGAHDRFIEQPPHAQRLERLFPAVDKANAAAHAGGQREFVRFEFLGDDEGDVVVERARFLERRRAAARRAAVFGPRNALEDVHVRERPGGEGLTIARRKDRARVRVRLPSARPRAARRSARRRYRPSEPAKRACAARY